MSEATAHGYPHFPYIGEFVTKLLKFREWVTLGEAARHICIVIDETVNESDLLRLAVDGHLKLSVNLVNGVPARCGCFRNVNQIDPPSPSTWSEHSREIPVQQAHSFPGQPVVHRVLAGLHPDHDPVAPTEIILENGQLLDLSAEIITIGGVWDLPMVGGERIDVETAYHAAVGGPEVMLYDENGIFVQAPDGRVCQLLSEPEVELLTRGGSQEEFERIQRRSQTYRLAVELPDDGVLVVRTEVLAAFQQTFLPPAKQIDRSLGRRERATLLTIIAALAKAAKIDIEKPSKAASTIENLTTEMGARVAARTVEEHLKNIPDALERRQS